MMLIFITNTNHLYWFQCIFCWKNKIPNDYWHRFPKLLSDNNLEVACLILPAWRVSSWCNGLSDRLQNRSKRVRTSGALLRSLSGKYPWKRYEPPYSPRYRLNSNTTVLLGEWLWHQITNKSWYAIKQRNQIKPDGWQVTIQEYFTLLPCYGWRNQSKWPLWIK